MEGILVFIGIIIIALLLGLTKQGQRSNKKYNRRKFVNYNSNNPENETTDTPETSDNSESRNNQEENNTEYQDNEIDYKKAYQPKLLFTKNEWYAHKKLREIAEVKGYIVCPKVRLLDIIEPQRDHKKYKTLFYKIQAKHVDFVICDKDMHIKAIVELDDNSHYDTKRKERDDFIDTILRSVGYTVIHTRYINYDILDLV